MRRRIFFSVQIYLSVVRRLKRERNEKKKKERIHAFIHPFIHKILRFLEREERNDERSIFKDSHAFSTEFQSRLEIVIIRRVKISFRKGALENSRGNEEFLRSINNNLLRLHCL